MRNLILLFSPFVILFSFGVSEVKAQNQTFPLAGATWFFKDDHPIWMDEYAEKWEYTGDSLTTEGVIKKIKVTSKIVNPGWGLDGVTTQEYNQYFLYVGDTIWHIDDALSPVANFSFQVGDSSYTPYHSALSPLYPAVLDTVYPCSEEEVSLFFQKGVVVEAGIETEDSIDFRYYKLKFRKDTGDTIIRKFSERSVITANYWYDINTVYGDCSPTDASTPSFVCYTDDFSANATCDDTENWFESLTIGTEEQLVNLEIFPNPFTDKFTVSNLPDNAKIKIYNLQGKELNFTKEEDVFYTRNFASGIYILSVFIETGTYSFKIRKD